MTIAITCPSCAKAYDVPEAVAGRNVRCKRCGTVFRASETVVLSEDDVLDDEADAPPPPPRSVRGARPVAPSAKAKGESIASRLADAPRTLVLGAAGVVGIALGYCLIDGLTRDLVLNGLGLLGTRRGYWAVCLSFLGVGAGAIGLADLIRLVLPLSKRRPSRERVRGVVGWGAVLIGVFVAGARFYRGGEPPPLFVSATQMLDERAPGAPAQAAPARDENPPDLPAGSPEQAARMRKCLDMITSADPERRVTGAHVLGMNPADPPEMGEPIRKALREMFNAGTPKERAAAILGLGRWGEAMDAEMAEANLDNPDVFLASAARQALGRLRPGR